MAKRELKLEDDGIGWGEEQTANVGENAK